MSKNLECVVQENLECVVQEAHSVMKEDHKMESTGLVKMSVPLSVPLSLFEFKSENMTAADLPLLEKLGKSELVQRLVYRR